MHLSVQHPPEMPGGTARAELIVDGLVHARYQTAASKHTFFQGSLGFGADDVFLDRIPAVIAPDAGEVSYDRLAHCCYDEALSDVVERIINGRNPMRDGGAA